MIRNVAVVGHLHHGKTALLDTLVFETHRLPWDSDRPVLLYTSLECVIQANAFFFVKPDSVYRHPSTFRLS